MKFTSSECNRAYTVSIPHSKTLCGGGHTFSASPIFTIPLGLDSGFHKLSRTSKKTGLFSAKASPLAEIVDAMEIVVENYLTKT